MTKIVTVYDNQEHVSFPVPDDWFLSVTELGWEVHVQSSDKEIGVADTAPTKIEAAKKVKQRMEYWLGPINDN